jgi:hypothetical protein
MRKAHLTFLFILLAGVLVARAEDKKTWEFQEGKWPQVTTPTTHPM